LGFYFAEFDFPRYRFRFNLGRALAGPANGLPDKPDKQEELAYAFGYTLYYVLDPSWRYEYNAEYD
jgi:hypothetical protein